MLGILRCKRGRYKEQIIDINGVKFLQIDTDNNIKKAMKSFKKHGVTSIASKQKYEKYAVKYIDHSYIFNQKKIEIITMLLKENNSIFVYARKLTNDILEFIEFLPRICDNIFLDLGQNTVRVSEDMQTKYGVAILSHTLNYDNNNKIAVYFDKPSKFKEGFLVINLTNELLEIPKGMQYVYDIDCETPYYSDDNTTDLTAICNALMIYDVKTCVKIKKIQIKA